MATAPALSPAPSAALHLSDCPLVAAYLPSLSSDDDDDDDDAADASSFLDADDSPDSLDDWSDDRPDSADDYDHTSDSDDSSLAWNTKSKKHPHAHAHAHPHPHPHPHLHHKKNSFHSACDYLSFFGALRKGFCSRHLDQRIDVYRAHKRADKSTVTGGGDLVHQDKERGSKAGAGGAGRGYTHKDHGGASSFSAMFKCTVADTPKNLLKRASFSENSDDQDLNAYQASAENVIERDLMEIDKKTRKNAASVEIPDLTMVLERDRKGSSKKLTDGPQLADNICKDVAHKQYGEAHSELGSNPLPNELKLSVENSNSKEDDQSSKHNKASEKRSCWRESDKKDLQIQGDWKHTTSDSSNKSSKNRNQVALVNTSERKDKGGVSLEDSAIQNLQEKTISTKDYSHGATEMAEVSTSLDKKATQTEALPDKAKLHDMPLHIYIKEKHPPEAVVKDPKRKTKAKKVKALKGKKLHLFRDGFTLPSATEPAGDAESTLLLDRQSESSNKVQSPTAAIKNKIPKEVLSTSATEDMRSPIIGTVESNAMEAGDGVPLRGATGTVAIVKISATPGHVIKTQVGDPVSDDSGVAVVALPGSAPKAASYPSVGYQNVKDGVSKISLTEGRLAAEPEAQSSGSFEENTMRTVITSMLPPLQKSSRKWFPPLDVALYNPVAGPEPATSLNVSLLAPQPPVGNSLMTTTMSCSPTALLHESNTESFGNIQGNLVPSGDILSSAPPNSSSFSEAPLASYHLGKRLYSSAVDSSSPRMLTMDISNAQYSRLIQLPVSQSQAYAPNSVSTLSLQQEIKPPAFFHVDGRASGNSSWIHSGTNSGPGFPFPMVSKTTSFGQIIGCVNQTLSMYKQMKSFSIEARYLVNVQSIVPGCCKLFLFNIESRQLHGVYVSSSLQTVSVGHEFPVAFDCIENYSIPLSVEELDTVLPEARQMDGRPLFLQPHTADQVVTLFERKNKPRLSWVPSTTNAVSVSGVHGLLEFSAVASESSCTQDHLVEALGQGSSVSSASPACMAINEVSKGCWSPLSSSLSAIVPESGQAFVAHEPDSSLLPAQVFPFPASSISNGEGAKSVWSEVAQSGFSKNLSEQGVAPSPMALWPHLFPKASSADTARENLLHMEAREGNITQNYLASVAEKIDIGARPDSESESPSFLQLPESGIRSTALRPKVAYNPLAVEQGRQRHLFDSSKPSSWSTLVPELDLQQTSQYGNRLRSQDNQYLASLSSPQVSEQPKMNNISGGPTIQLSATPVTQLPSHYQMEHALPDALRSDLGLSKTGTAQTTSAWSEDSHSMHQPTISSEGATEAANLDHTNLCCYCFTRRADHLIIDCQHLGPCLECAASKKIEYCGQLNCQTKVTRLLRLFR